MESTVTISTKEYAHLIRIKTLTEVLHNNIRVSLVNALRDTEKQSGKYGVTNYVEESGIMNENICRLFGWEEDYLECLCDANATISKKESEENGEAE